MSNDGDHRGRSLVASVVRKSKDKQFVDNVNRNDRQRWTSTRIVAT
jgi:hypothetical protein